MRIGLIGAGRMGKPILERLAAAGHQCRGLTRRPDTLSEVAADQIGWRTSIGETVAGADAVFIVVLNDVQVREVCLGATGAIATMKPGSVLVQHTTSDPLTAKALADEAGARGVRVLDAALSGGPHDIAEGRLTLWVGGEADVLEELRSVLEAYASPILFVGPLGNGQKTKLINNALFVAQMGLAIDAVRLGGALGIEESAILSSLQYGSGASRAMSVVASGGSVDALADRLGALMEKDVNTVNEVSARAGLDLGITGAVLASDAVVEWVLGRRPDAHDERVTT